MENLIVFTGGPGSGKTAVIDLLQERGFQCAGETGRKVIQQQVKQGGIALPWLNKSAFRDEMLREEIANYECYRNSKERVFFDRGIVDCYGYSRLENISVSKELLNLCKLFEYNKQVFIFPPWKNIFSKDAERKQDFAEAVATYDEMIKAYERFGYSLIEVPKLSVQRRVAFILTMEKRNDLSG